MEELDLKEMFNIFWDKRIHIAIIVAVFLIIGIIYTMFFTTPMYNATTTLVLAQSKDAKNAENNTNTITSTDIAINSKLAATYGELIKSKNILGKVKTNLGLDVDENVLRSMIRVNSVSDTDLITIVVTNKNPSDASKIANETAKVFIETVKEIYNINNVQIISQAETPTAPSNINHKKDIAQFGIVGIAVAIMYILVINMFDTTIKKSEEVEKEFGVSVLASIPFYNIDDKDKKELVLHKDPKSPVSEIFRTLRTNIQFMNNKDKLKTILITSTVPGEGKSWISSNLAVAFAQSDKKVVLVDTDMRKGRQYSIFEVSPKPGLSNYLSGINSSKGDESSKDLASYVQETEVENLNVITAGNIPPNPSELLTSSKMAELLEGLKGVFDIIIIDGTPTGLVTDSLVLTRLVDTTVVVSASKQTKKGDLKKILTNVKDVGGKVSGVIVNKLPISAKKYEQSYYYGSKDTSKGDKTK